MHATIDYRREGAPLQVRRNRPYIARAPWLVTPADDPNPPRGRRHRCRNLSEALSEARRIGYETATVDGIPLDTVALDNRGAGDHKEEIRVTQPGHTPRSRQIAHRSGIPQMVLWSIGHYGPQHGGRIGCEVEHNGWSPAELALFIVRPARPNERLEVDYGPRGALCRFGDNGDAFEVQFPAGVAIVPRVFPAGDGTITEEEMRFIHNRVKRIGLGDVDVEVVTDQPRPEYPQYHLSREAGEAPEAENLQDEPLDLDKLFQSPQSGGSGMKAGKKTGGEKPPMPTPSRSRSAESPMPNSDRVGPDPEKPEPAPSTPSRPQPMDGQAEAPIQVHEPDFGGSPSNNNESGQAAGTTPRRKSGFAAAAERIAEQGGNTEERIEDDDPIREPIDFDTPPESRAENGAGASTTDRDVDESLDTGTTYVPGM